MIVGRPRAPFELDEESECWDVIRPSAAARQRQRPAASAPQRRGIEGADAWERPRIDAGDE